MNGYLDLVERKMRRHRAQALTRRPIPIQPCDTKNQIKINNQLCINFCSNDYLCLSTHPAVKQSFAEAVHQYGFGSGASALVSGYFHVQQELEMAFSDFLNRERSLFFNSGYAANIGVLTALAGRHSRILSDRLSHASLLDGIALSRAKHIRFRHNEISDLDRLLNEGLGQEQWIVTEGVFSMGGDLAPLRDIVDLSHKHRAGLIVDDAHGIGVLGKQGGGVCEHFNLTAEEVPCLVLPLGKAFGGMGAIVSGSSDIIEAILQFASSYRCTTALPPALCVALQTVLKLIRSESWRREKLQRLILFFMEQAKERHLALVFHEPTPIQSILIFDNQRVQDIQQQMLARGFFVSCIRPPTVPPGKAQIRISLNCDHTESEIENLLDHLSFFLRE